MILNLKSTTFIIPSKFVHKLIKSFLKFHEKQLYKNYKILCRGFGIINLKL